MEENDEEIIIGVNIPNMPKEKNKKKKKKKKVKKEVVKKTTSKEKKTKARIFGKSKIFRNRLIKKIIILILIIIAVIIFLSSSFFNVKDIEIENNELVTKEEIISLIQLGDNCNIFGINQHKINQKLKENPYIENVTIKRIIPNKIVLNITERKIKYMLQLGNAYLYLNNQGYILDISTEAKNFPLIIGCTTDTSELKKGNRLISSDLEKIDMVNRICETANNNGILPLISKIDISDSKNYTLYLESEKKIVYLGNGSDLNTRMLYINAILEQESGIEGEIFVNVDLNTENVFFREKI